MFGAVSSAFLCGIKSVIVRVEADVSYGLPGFDMVGDLSSQVRESKERVRTAIKNSGISLPAKKTVINICPADIHKQGSSMDIAIAVAVLTAHDEIPGDALGDTVFVGELGLEGRINGINGVMTMVSAAKAQGYKRCIIPKDNISEGSVIDGITVYGAETLGQVVAFLKGEDLIEPTKCCAQEIFEEETGRTGEDFSDINGQTVLKRACEIAAAGMHNLLMIGPPGSGKTMAARRIPGILPSITLKEAIEISSLYSVNGMLPGGKGLMAKRPFREVHHTVTKIAMIGGAGRAGEVSLADKGVLFLDEFPEFAREVLETLRQPMESGKISISRASNHVDYPARFMLVAAMNPCKCGYYPDLNKCNCTSSEIKRYLSKVSGPMLDRIDICTETSRVEYSDIVSTGKSESSEAIRSRVEAAHEIQRKRFAKYDYSFNSAMPSSHIRKYCVLDDRSSDYMKKAFDHLELSARTYNKTLKVARTIADLEAAENISLDHLREALLFRGLDKKYIERQA